MYGTVGLSSCAYFGRAMPLGARRITGRDAAIGERVRQIRNEKGISQTGLGRAIGITFQQVQKYESGTNRIESGRLARISAALGVPITVLFGSGSGKKQRHLPSPVDDLKVDGAIRLLQAYQRITGRGVRTALLQIAEHLAKR
jgi:transcriptional regulator with XRE-family HTH domain